MKKKFFFCVVLVACGVLCVAFPQTLSGRKFVTLDNTPTGQPVTVCAVVAVTPESGVAFGSVQRTGETAGIFSFPSAPPPNSRHALWNC